MIGRLLSLVLIPVWAWMLLAVTTGLFAVVVVLVLIVGGATSTIASDLHYQCDSAVGPDPSQTMTPGRTTAAVRPTARSAPAAGVTTAPTTNPFAELTIAPDDTSASAWHRACASVLKDAPYQSPPLLTGSSGFGPACARQLALAQAGAAPTGAQGSAADRVGAAEFTSAIIYLASAAQSTGRCELTASAVVPPPTADVARQPSGSARRACGQADSSGTGVVVLPKTIAAQGACGQRVDPSAISAGDLVFWNHRNNAPTEVGIAVSGTELVTADPVSGGFVERVIPSTNDVRVKRVLGSGE
ncbi:hypothetical protein [Nocardia abscessus]|uniref:hypothetical protein n=1 Tax=Nocardia abscessus TaxID=120957 RepID=UPI002457C3FB|nr:hypothetical protein [Nocardia abscessus]